MSNSLSSIENHPKADLELASYFAALESCVVAFSGGVDSSVVAAAALRVLGDRAVAVTGIGPAVSATDLDMARQVAAAIGIRHVLVETTEIRDPNYRMNDGRRCFFCKSNLYARLRQWADEHGFKSLVSGTNLDDLGDYRPGLEAAKQYKVHAPLAELKIGKKGVRELAKHWNLPVANRPASPCLASRIAYGESVTEQKLSKLEQAERWLNEHGFVDVRVRLHPGELARVEVSSDDIERICASNLRNLMTNHFKEIGFQFVTLDLIGRQSGSLNRLLPIYSG
jgi:pyridinium-3,5-biscarboxylic acid mononucleotide sulfurtransferase